MFWFWRKGFGWGRGYGWGARLGYCPWTGLPRGWRFRWPYYGTYTGYYPPYFAPSKDVELQTLKNYANLLETELKAIKNRIAQLEQS